MAEHVTGLRTEMSTYVPYRDIAPQTTDLRILRDELERVREEYGLGSSQSLEAFNRYCHAAGQQGRPIDGLRRHVADETERFFAFTIQGPDGHVYWHGTSDFLRNDGAYRRPSRWWWEHLHGQIGTTTRRVRPTCGQTNCINPEHSVLEHFAPTRYTDEHILGRLQVLEMQLGHPPNQREWEASGSTPVDDIVRKRFGGTWDGALRAAGLTPVVKLTGVPGCIASLRFARDFLGRWPRARDFRAGQNPELKEGLQAAGLSHAENTVYKHFRNWTDAIREAAR